MIRQDHCRSNISILQYYNLRTCAMSANYWRRDRTTAAINVFAEQIVPRDLARRSFAFTIIVTKPVNTRLMRLHDANVRRHRGRHNARLVGDSLPFRARHRAAIIWSKQLYRQIVAWFSHCNAVDFRSPVRFPLRQPWRWIFAYNSWLSY